MIKNTDHHLNFHGSLFLDIVIKLNWGICCSKVLTLEQSLKLNCGMISRVLRVLAIYRVKSHDNEIFNIDKFLE